MNPRNCHGDAFYHVLLPPRLHFNCASDVSFGDGRRTRHDLNHFFLVGVSRFSRVGTGRRNFLGRLLRGPITGLQGPCNAAVRRVHHCTSFVKADGLGSLLASPSKDHHFVYVRIANPVRAGIAVGCRRLCTRTVRSVVGNRHC